MLELLLVVLRSSMLLLLGITYSKICNAPWASSTAAKGTWLTLASRMCLQDLAARYIPYAYHYHSQGRFHLQHHSTSAMCKYVFADVFAFELDHS